MADDAIAYQTKKYETSIDLPEGFRFEFRWIGKLEDSSIFFNMILHILLS